MSRLVAMVYPFVPSWPNAETWACWTRVEMDPAMNALEPGAG